MAGFVQKTVNRTAVRDLAVPIADVTSFNNLIETVIEDNLFGCVGYTGSVGVPVAAVVRNREHYTAKVDFVDGEGMLITLLSRLAPLSFHLAKESISMISTEDDSMSAAENISVSKETYNQILDLRHPGETLDETLARLVEKVKKQRLTDDIEEVMARNEFVALDL